MGIPGVGRQFLTEHVRKRESIRQMGKGEAAEVFFAFLAAKNYYE